MDTTTTSLSYFGWIEISEVPCTVHPKYGKTVSGHTLGSVEKQIARYLASSDAVLTGVEFMFLRKVCGLSKAEVARKFVVDVATITNWEKKTGPIDVPYQAYMRVICLPILHFSRYVDDRFVSHGDKQPVHHLVWSQTLADDEDRRSA